MTEPHQPQQPHPGHPPAGYETWQAPVGPAVPAQTGWPAAYQPPPASGMYVAAAVLNWVTLGLVVVSTFGVGIIAAAWYIPMTIRIHKGARDRQKHTALAVCSLIFCNLIGGILLLVEDGNRSASCPG